MEGNTDAWNLAVLRLDLLTVVLPGTEAAHDHRWHTILAQPVVASFIQQKVNVLACGVQLIIAKCKEIGKLPGSKGQDRCIVTPQSLRGQES